MWMIGVILGVLLVWLIVVYNGMVSLRNRGDNAWSDIDVQLKRRHDLIPNIVKTVQGYATHEREVLEEVATLRSRAVAATDREGPRGRGTVEGTLAGQLGRLFALVEAYPDLKADQNFRDLQRSLTEVEDHLQSARRYYNAVVRDFNTRLQVFPNVLVAGLFGFREKEFFQLDDPDERRAAAVDFHA